MTTCLSSDRSYKVFGAPETLLNDVDFAKAKSELLDEREYQRASEESVEFIFQGTPVRGVTPAWSVPQTAFSGTLILEETRSTGKPDAFAGSVDPARAENRISYESESRLVLLARKFASSEKLSAEDNARLIIATERVRALLPAATALDYEWLASTLDEIKLLEDSAAKTGDELKKLLSDGG